MSAISKLQILIRLTELLEGITVQNGYKTTVLGVYRGRNEFGTETAQPFIALLEAPRADIAQFGNEDHTISKDEWTILVQGFAEYNAEHPTDPAYVFLTDVENRLSMINSTRQDGRVGGEYPEWFRLGGLITDMVLEQPVVRPADKSISSTAFFYQPVRFTLVRDIKC